MTITRATSSPLSLKEHGRQHAPGRRTKVTSVISSFAGPTVLVLELATILLIVAFRSAEFVDVVVVANLTLIVFMMALKASFGCAVRRDCENADDAPLP